MDAEIALKLKNLSDAVEAYTNAINLLPAGDAFLKRANVFVAQGKVDLAIKDLSHSIHSQCSLEIQKAARFERARIYSNKYNFRSEILEEDLEWLKANTDGKDLAQTLLLDIGKIADGSTLNALDLKDLEENILPRLESLSRFY